MVRILLSVCLWLMFNAQAFAEIVSTPATLNPLQLVSNGTLSITLDTAPAIGLPAPKILVLHGFHTVYQNEVNWNSSWNLNVPSGNYKIIPLPVSDGINFYLANSIFVFVPPNSLVNSLISYHII